ncbi:hypothetical protein RI367_007502 [Sorochytrium milnesiophthora]
MTTATLVQHQQRLPHLHDILEEDDSSASGVQLLQTGPLHRYRQSKNVSARKLFAFFGDCPPLDIPVPEIRREGLKALLLSKLPLCYFLRQLLDNYAHENLFFWLEMQRYQLALFPTPEAHVDAAVSLYATYLAPLSPLEVNIDDRLRRSITAKLEALVLFVNKPAAPSAPATVKVPQRKHSLEGQHTQQSSAALAAAAAGLPPLTHENISPLLATVFDPAKDAAYELMDSLYTKFTRSTIFNTMLDDIGHMQVYTPESRDAALSCLADYLEAQGMLGSRNGNSSSMADASIVSMINTDDDLFADSELGDILDPPSSSSSNSNGSRKASRDTWNMTDGYKPHARRPSYTNQHIEQSASAAQDANASMLSALTAQHMRRNSGANRRSAQKSLLKRMIRGLTITLLDVDVVQFARARLDAAAFDDSPAPRAASPPQHSASAKSRTRAHTTATSHTALAYDESANRSAVSLQHHNRA